MFPRSRFLREETRSGQAGAQELWRQTQGREPGDQGGYSEASMSPLHAPAPLPRALALFSKYFRISNILLLILYYLILFTALGDK